MPDWISLSFEIPEFIVFLKTCKNLPQCGRIWRDLKLYSHLKVKYQSEYTDTLSISTVFAFASSWSLLSFSFFILYLLFSLS